MARAEGGLMGVPVSKEDFTQTLSLPGCFLATYRLQPHYEYSERHAVYVEDIKKIEGLPPPHPSSASKDDIFDIRLYKDIDKRAEKAPAKLLKEPYLALITYLTSGCKDDLACVRAIYRWVTSLRLDRLTLPPVMPPPTVPFHQLWRIKNKKGNYAQLVSILCRMANIPCVIIHGVLKGSTYDVGQKLDEKAHYGEWNAVLIQHQWRLMNAYWGACAIGSEGGDDWMEIDDGGEDVNEQKTEEKATREYVYMCDENYFLTDPRQLISTHYPSRREWQLLNEPITMAQFEKMAFLKDRFFNLGMSVVSHPECVVHSQSGEVELTFGLPEEDAVFLKFYYLLFRQEIQADDGLKPTYDRYVFMHRPKKTELSVRIRSPIAGTFRLELVGRDVRVNDPNYDYDWVTLYKIRFHKAKDRCLPFPDMPTLGWGPNLHAAEMGLASLTHHTGEVRASQRGEAEIAFTINDSSKLAKPTFFGRLKRAGVKEETVKDRLVHRVEDGKVIFNVKLPKKGEYSLRLNGLSQKLKGKPRSFANYMVVSDQKEYLEGFPSGFESGLGRKAACDKFGLTPISHPGGLIYTDQEDVDIVFQKTKKVDLSVSVLGSEVVVSDSRRLVSQSQEGDMIKFTIRLPRTGTFGVKIIGRSETIPTFESVYDYIIEYLRPVSTTGIRVEPEGEEVLKPLRKSRARTQAPSPSPAQESREDEARKRVDVAVEAEDEVELKAAVQELAALGTERSVAEKARADYELSILKMKRDLSTATRDRDLQELNRLISLCKEKGFEKRLVTEMANAKVLQARLQHVQQLLHQVQSLNQQTITEIRHYAKPPPVVQRVMMATLLLLGHFEEETQDWSKVQAIIGRTGRESLKRRCEDLVLDTVPLDVALGARELLKDFTLDQVRMVSAGAASFYIWSKGLIEELETRFGEEVARTRPRTSQSRRGRRKQVGFEQL